MSIEQAVNYFFSMGLIDPYLNQYSPEFSRAEKIGDAFKFYFTITNKQTGEKGRSIQTISEKDIEFELIKRRLYALKQNT